MGSKKSRNGAGGEGTNFPVWIEDEHRKFKFYRNTITWDFVAQQFGIDKGEIRLIDPNEPETAIALTMLQPNKHYRVEGEPISSTKKELGWKSIQYFLLQILVIFGLCFISHLPGEWIGEERAYLGGVISDAILWSTPVFIFQGLKDIASYATQRKNTAAKKNK